jgi:hypothetical protein
MFTVNLAAKDHVIENPAYEFNTTGLSEVSRIVLGENETRLYVHSTFLPGWWVRFDKTDYIEDCATGKKWYVSRIENGELGKEIFMPASGDSMFILIFPKIDKSVEKINLKGEEAGSWSIYGISLNPKAKRRDNTVPQEVRKWIDEELAKASRKTLMDFDAGEFFSHDTARLIGYIKGYDRRAYFSTGTIVMTNEIINEKKFNQVNIDSDGRFECLLPVKYPLYLTIYFDKFSIDFYIQPGTSLSMILDWEEFRKADRLRNIKYKFSDIQFDGATAAVNKELTAFYAKHGNPISIDHAYFKRRYSNQTSDQIAAQMYSVEITDEHKDKVNQLTSTYTDACRQLESDNDISPFVKSIIRNNYLTDYVECLMNYGFMSENILGIKENSTVKIRELLNPATLNDHQILTSIKFGNFLAYLEISLTSNEKYNWRKSEKSFIQYLYEELGLKKTPDDVKHFEYIDSLSKQFQNSAITHEELNNLLTEINRANGKFNARYKEQMTDYSEKYLKNPSLPYETVLKQWQISDSIYTNVLNIEPGVITDVIKIRKLPSIFTNMQNNKEDLKKILEYLKKSLHNDFLKQEAERLFKQSISLDGEIIELSEIDVPLAFRL